ncbi:MAG: VCBS repeat-containing protein [Planctomycetes bacterium]|nr:VCBS repeat-containing protein [Planctomycetota bacterium]
MTIRTPPTALGVWVLVPLLSVIAASVPAARAQFAPAVHYAAGDGPNSVAIGDLDGDQVPDLAVVNQYNHPGTNDVSVLLGFGDGTFAPAAHFFTGDRARSVAIGDLDYDGVPDLAVANTETQNVAVLRGVGDGTFLAALHFVTGNSPESVAIGDLDGDLVSDLALARFGGTVSILFNQAQLSGTCCLDTSCSIETCADCRDSGGTFLGPDTTCDDTTDTDGDGVSDVCDVCPFGDDTVDTDSDGIPNDCDECPNGSNTVDSDGDGVFDGCDACDNNVPGDCDLVSLILAAAPHDILKNRYISIDPRGEDLANVGGLPFDIRVTLSSTLVNGVTAVGSSWWANEPGRNCISVVGPTQPVSPINWDACSTLHLTGCPIMPSSTYDIVPVIDGLQFGPALAADTQARPAGGKWWGDVVGHRDPVADVWGPPNGFVAIDDAVAAIKTFQDPTRVGPGCAITPCNATHVSLTDVHPAGSPVEPWGTPNLQVDINDVFAIILGFQGFEYPGPEIQLCTDP